MNSRRVWRCCRRSELWLGASGLGPARLRSGSDVLAQLVLSYATDSADRRQRMPASMNSSISPSNTADGLPTSKFVRRSFTIWYGCRTYDRIWLPQELPPSLSASMVAFSSCRRLASSLACSTVMADARFWICERSFWQDTTMPVGMWVIRTAESVVLTPWPPGPEER